MRALLVSLALLLVLPATASARVIDDRSRGYKLSANSKTFEITLTIPSALVGGKRNAYSIACKATKRGEESGLIGFLEVDPTRKLRGPGSYFPNKMRFCRLETDGKLAARFKLR